VETERKTVYIVFDGKRYSAYASKDLNPSGRRGINRLRHTLEDKLTREGYTHFEYLTKTPAGRGFAQKLPS